MFASRLFWRVYSGYVAVILLTAVVIGVHVTRQVEEATLSQIRDRLLESALVAAELVVADPAAQVDTDRLQLVLRRLSDGTGVRYTYIADSGVVAAETGRDPTTMENHGDRPEVLAARLTGTGTATRRSSTLGVRMMYTAVRTPAGFMRSALPLEVVQDRRDTVRSTIALSVGVAAVLGLLLGMLVTRRFSRPLVDMADTARSMAAGRFDRRLHVDRSDEIGALGHSFNLMAAEVQERIERITEDRDRLQTMLAGMVEGVIAVDPEERVLLLNDVAGKILGSDRAVLGSPIRNVTRMHEVADVLADVLRSGVDRRQEILLTAPGGDRILEVHAGPFGSDESPQGAVVLLHDVTELRRLEAVRRDFVANVSHELKTPLTAIRGMLETMLDDPQMPEDIRRGFLERMDAQSDRLAHLVTDLLTLARVETRPEDLEREPLDVRHPVRESMRALEGSAIDREIRLDADFPEVPLSVLGDRPSLRLLFDNVVDNAVKYTPPGGHVHVRLQAEDRWVLVEVRDTGIGIDPRHGDRVFERFYRVDKARSRELGGTGLGLAIVKHVARAHDGDVTYESTPGAGTVFRVRLPIASGAPQGSGDTAPVAARPFRFG